MTGGRARARCVTIGTGAGVAVYERPMAGFYAGVSMALLLCWLIPPVADSRFLPAALCFAALAAWTALRRE